MQSIHDSLILDTHIWYWYVSGEKKLAPNLIKKIDEAGWENRLFISCISVWEMAMLAAKGRITLSLPAELWIEQAIGKSRIQLLELTKQILIQSCFLPNFFHGDPADRMIIAAAKLNNLRLVTADQKILDYGRVGKIKVLSCK